MASGRVVEQGTHEQLVESRGAYFDLINNQNFDKEEEPSTSSDTEEETKEVLAKTPTVTEKVQETPLLPRVVSVAANADPTLAAIIRSNQPELAPEKYTFWALLKWTLSFGKPEFTAMFLAFIFCVICGLGTPVHSGKHSFIAHIAHINIRSECWLIRERQSSSPSR